MQKLVLFDIDGTLIETSKAHSMAFSEAFLEIYGIDTSIEVIEHHGMTDRAIITEVMRKSGVDYSVIQGMMEACVEHLVKAFERIADQEGISVLDGAHDLLEELSARPILTGIVTGNLEAVAWSKLRRVGLRRYLRFGAFGSDALERSDLVTLAISRATENWEFQSGEEIYFFGDTPRDVEAARVAGVKSVALMTGIYGRAELRRAGADLILKDLTDREPILEFILG